jgi:hypothetical protein
MSGKKKCQLYEKLFAGHISKVNHICLGLLDVIFKFVKKKKKKKKLPLKIKLEALQAIGITPIKRAKIVAALGLVIRVSGSSSCRSD